MSPTKKTEIEIAEAAFYIWLEEGQPHGRHEEHWHRARTEIETAKEPEPEAKKRPAKPKAAKPRAKAQPKAAKTGAKAVKAEPAAKKPAPRVAKPRKAKPKA